MLDDDLEVITSIEKLGRASLIFEQRIVRGDEPIATGKVRVGVIGARSFVPTPLPDDLYETIKAFMQRKPERPSPNTLSFNAIQKAVI